MLRILFWVTMVCPTQGAALDAAGGMTLAVTSKGTMRKEVPITYHQRLGQPTNVNNTQQPEIASDNRIAPVLSFPPSNVEQSLNRTLGEEDQQSGTLPTLSNGDIITLQQPTHSDSYLGMCGHSRTGGACAECGGSNHCVFSFASAGCTADRCKWQVELQVDLNAAKTYIWLKTTSPGYSGFYLGVCGNGEGCGTSKYNVLTYPNKAHLRTKWSLETASPYVYLKNEETAHSSAPYIGLCGHATNTCGSSVYGVKAHPKEDRTKWTITKVSR